MRLNNLFETLADFAPCFGKFIEVGSERLQQALYTEDDGEYQNDIAERNERVSRERDNGEYHRHAENDEEHAIEYARRAYSCIAETLVRRSTVAPLIVVSTSCASIASGTRLSPRYALTPRMRHTQTKNIHPMR